MKLFKFKIIVLTSLIMFTKIGYTYQQIEFMLFLQPQTPVTEHEYLESHYPLPAIDKVNQIFETVDLFGENQKNMHTTHNTGRLYKYIPSLIARGYKILVYKIITPPISINSHFSLFVTNYQSLINQLKNNIDQSNYYSRQFYKEYSNNALLVGTILLSKAIRNIFDIKLHFNYKNVHTDEIYLAGQRKIIPNQINYFDHPIIGCLIVLT